jgi:mRNA interferase YafQ
MILILEPKFQKSLKQLVKRNPQLKDKIQEALMYLDRDPYTPSLKSHKLTGKLKEYWSCSVAADCRIIFSFQQDLETGENLLKLSDIGSHDDVYYKK